MTNINAALLRQLCSINLLCSDTTVKSKFDKSVTLFITPCKIQNKINFKSCGNSKRRDENQYINDLSFASTKTKF